jgi:fatty-acid desaturase
VYKHHRIQWFRAMILASFHLLALSALVCHFELRFLPIMIGLYLWMGFSTTFYLHRCLTHRAFETTGWIKFLCFLGVSVGQQGDPVGWVGHHRWHHAKADTDLDVHSPAAGFAYAHFGWILRNPGEDEHHQRDLAKDIRTRYAYARLAEKQYLFFLPHLATAMLLFGTLGFGGMAWCLYVPMVAVYHVTWSVNSLCHMWGYRTTDTPDLSRNFWLTGLLALGEGWHNNHHACQTRAPQGLEWYEVDLTKMLIAGLEKVGLVWNVRWTAPVRSTPLHAEAPTLGEAAAV